MNDRSNAFRRSGGAGGSRFGRSLEKILWIGLGSGLMAGGYWIGSRPVPGGGERGLDLKFAPRAEANAPVTSRFSPVVEVASRVSSSVVTIGTTRVVASGEGFRRSAASENFFPYMGSGFLVSGSSVARGSGGGASTTAAGKIYVMTNYHVVEGSQRVFVTLTDGREFQARMLDADAVVDVALLELQTNGERDIPTIGMGDSDKLMIGETVIAMGNPFGPLIDDPHPSVTVGVVSALNRSFQPEVDPDSGSARVYHNMIQTDAAVNPGNSGGPLLDLDGNVIGINTFIIAPGSGQSAGVNFSIPINRAARVAQEILAHGKVRSLYLDFDVAPMNRAMAAKLNVDTGFKGLVVYNMAGGGPATRSGLTKGDVITQVNGRNVARKDDLMAYFYSRTVGEKLRFTVARDGRKMDIDYEIAEGGRS